MFRILGGRQRGPNSQQAHDVVTSFRRHVPTRFLINQCQIITFLIFKSDNIENSRIELKGIVLPVPSNQIKVTFIITVKPVLRGHCIKGSPALSSHLLGSLEPKYSANEPVLRGHLS